MWILTGLGGVGRGPFREMKVANCFVFLDLLECHFCGNTIHCVSGL